MRVRGKGDWGVWVRGWAVGGVAVRGDGVVVKQGLFYSVGGGVVKGCWWEV